MLCFQSSNTSGHKVTDKSQWLTHKIKMIASLSWSNFSSLTKLLTDVYKIPLLKTLCKNSFRKTTFEVKDQLNFRFPHVMQFKLGTVIDEHHVPQFTEQKTFSVKTKLPSSWTIYFVWGIARVSFKIKTRIIKIWLHFVHTDA